MQLTTYLVAVIQVVKSEFVLIKYFEFCRFVTGIEFREGSLLISPKTQLPAKKGLETIFNYNIHLYRPFLTKAGNLKLLPFCVRP